MEEYMDSSVFAMGLGSQESFKSMVLIERQTVTVCHENLGGYTMWAHANHCLLVSVHYLKLRRGSLLLLKRVSRLHTAVMLWAQALATLSIPFHSFT